MDYIDNEWDAAENTDEKPIYYYLIPKFGYKFIKQYKPSVAELVKKRTGYVILPVTGMKGE
jgi:hypothetical protein